MPYSNPQKQRDFQKNWIATKRSKDRDSQRRYWKKIRKQVIDKLGGRCINCGCDNPDALEINHINGGGNEDKRINGNGKQFYLHILNGTRKTDDLEMTCIVCNALHRATKIQHIDENWTVIWKPKPL